MLQLQTASLDRLARASEPRGRPARSTSTPRASRIPLSSTAWPPAPARRTCLPASICSPAGAAPDDFAARPRRAAFFDFRPCHIDQAHPRCPPHIYTCPSCIAAVDRRPTSRDRFGAPGRRQTSVLSSICSEDPASTHLDGGDAPFEARVRSLACFRRPPRCYARQRSSECSGTVLTAMARRRPPTRSSPRRWTTRAADIVLHSSATAPSRGPSSRWTRMRSARTRTRR